MWVHMVNVSAPIHSRANWLLWSMMNAKRAGVKNSEKIPNGEGGMGTLGPALPVNGEMLECSADDLCTFALHVQVIINT